MTPVWLARRLHRELLGTPATRTRISAYLDLRASRWPRTANPHLFINALTATHIGPTSNVWATKVLGVSARALREDRIVDEVLATGDPRHLCDLFGLSIEGAARYLAVLDPAPQ
ncbi:hypothetical protein [Streptomyces phaeochromogenes]|uniref:hypothetical protein n=1 Tax=Streptomyces phaeochromogenes TaxID=1923 RepID=UPI003688D7CE